MYPIAPSRTRTGHHAGTWLPVAPKGDRPRTARVACPHCGAAEDLDPRAHRIDRRGSVSTTWSCPRKCGFAKRLSLQEWGGELDTILKEIRP
jgi:predicted RNA-binding Zn-ribbon protein involved in translation (DUF1610 family)